MFEGMRYVLAVYQEKSFSHAALKLHISQPSLSASIRREEASIGTSIFDRSVKPFRVTEAGKKYIDAALRIQSIEESFQDYLSKSGTLTTGTLSIGGTSLYSSFLLSRMIQAFSTRYPGVSVDLIERPSALLGMMLEKEEIDLLMDNVEMDPHSYERIPYREEYLLLAVPGSYPVNQKLVNYQIPYERIQDHTFMAEQLPIAPLSAFDQLPFILLKPENHTSQMASRIFSNHAIHPQIVLELDSMLTAYYVTVSGMGISFISSTLLQGIQHSGAICFYKLPPEESKRMICFYRKARSDPKHTVREFLRLIAPDKSF